jgi:hypothetical protein
MSTRHARGMRLRNAESAVCKRHESEGHESEVGRKSESHERQSEEVIAAAWKMTQDFPCLFITCTSKHRAAKFSA